MNQNIFLGTPTHNGQMDHRSVNAMLCDATQHYDRVLTMVRTSSLLANNCNYLYCDALNKRTQMNLKWFAMLHGDIVPAAGWLDQLIDIAEKGNYDMLAAHSPIKSNDGLTSTAMEINGKMRRLTNAEILNPLLLDEIDQSFVNEYYEADYLLLNTGCMIVRLDQPWSHRVYFNITDRISEREGKFVAEVFSEDWHFSKMVQDFGGKVAATRRVNLTHIGVKPYSIHDGGTYSTDPDYKP